MLVLLVWICLLLKKFSFTSYSCFKENVDHFFIVKYMYTYSLFFTSYPYSRNLLHQLLWPEVIAVRPSFSLAYTINSYFNKIRFHKLLYKYKRKNERKLEFNLTTALFSFVHQVVWREYFNFKFKHFHFIHEPSSITSYQITIFVCNIN